MKRKKMVKRRGSDWTVKGGGVRGREKGVNWRREGKRTGEKEQYHQSISPIKGFWVRQSEALAVTLPAQCSNRRETVSKP